MLTIAVNFSISSVGIGSASEWVIRGVRIRCVDAPRLDYTFIRCCIEWWT